MSLIAINIITPSEQTLASYEQSIDDPDIWTWFDEHGDESFTDEQKVTLRRISATGKAEAMMEDRGHGKYYCWFDGRTFDDIRVAAIFI